MLSYKGYLQQAKPIPGKTNLWNYRPRNRGTAEPVEPAEPMNKNTVLLQLPLVNVVR